MLKLVLVHTTATSTTTVNTIVVASCTRTLATASAAAAATVTSMTIATGPFVAAYAQQPAFIATSASPSAPAEVCTAARGCIFVAADLDALHIDSADCQDSSLTVGAMPAAQRWAVFGSQERHCISIWIAVSRFATTAAFTVARAFTAATSSAIAASTTAASSAIAATSYPDTCLDTAAPYS